jgi:hypothetical protein
MRESAPPASDHNRPVTTAVRLKVEQIPLLSG